MNLVEDLDRQFVIDNKLKDFIETEHKKQQFQVSFGNRIRSY